MSRVETEEMCTSNYVISTPAHIQYIVNLIITDPMEHHSAAADINNTM